MRGMARGGTGFPTAVSEVGILPDPPRTVARAVFEVRKSIWNRFEAGGWWQMKVRSSVRRLTKDCQIVRRKGKVRVINKKDPRMKQVQG